MKGANRSGGHCMCRNCLGNNVTVELAILLYSLFSCPLNVPKVFCEATKAEKTKMNFYSLLNTVSLHFKDSEQNLCWVSGIVIDVVFSVLIFNNI